MLLLSLFFLISPSQAASKSTEEIDFTINRFREYCAACHAIGNKRFIYSEDNQEVWNYIFATKAPNSNKTWAEEIKTVLNWPSDTPPPFDKLMDPAADRDWMPKGAKRLSFAKDKVEDEFIRRRILSILSKPL